MLYRPSQDSIASSFDLPIEPQLKQGYKINLLLHDERKMLPWHNIHRETKLH
jgi:hypothetical protein